MPPRRRPQPAILLKPLRGFQFSISMLLFLLSTYIISIPETYMSITSTLMLMIISFCYLSISTVAIMTLREGDIIRINPTFALDLLGIPLFVIIAVISKFSPTSDPNYWGVKTVVLFCFSLTASFVVEIVLVISQYRRR